MTPLPLRFDPVDERAMLLTNDAGGFFRADEAFLQRYASGRMDAKDEAFLVEFGHAFSEKSDLARLGHAYRWSKRQFVPSMLAYVILVPTLRCDLACRYCQVSRANVGAAGFDWSDEVLGNVLSYLASLDTRRIKIEFQGGEPTLRLDLLHAVRDFCREHFASCEFVVCTNLQNLSEETWAFLAEADTFVSTSLDGNFQTHTRQRTQDMQATETFTHNLDRALRELGPARISCLPTIDPADPPSAQSVIETFASRGLRSIYLRPVNYQGFARKRFGRGDDDVWNSYYGAFIDALVRYNATAPGHLEEYYFVHCLRRVLRPGQDNHVDVRNPNVLGKDYLVIDYDGAFYPTDEARMVTRVGQIDLSMGNVFKGIDQDKLAALNTQTANNYHEDCLHCAYQPFCGVDLIDDLSRYGRIDLAKAETSFCQRHMFIFRKIFDLLYSRDPDVHKSLALWLDVPAFDSALAPVHS